MSESSAEEDGMAFGHLLDTYPRSLAVTRRPLGRSGPASAGLAHLVGMDTDTTTPRVLEPALTLSELAARRPGTGAARTAGTLFEAHGGSVAMRRDGWPLSGA